MIGVRLGLAFLIGETDAIFSDTTAHRTKRPVLRLGLGLRRFSLGTCCKGKTKTKKSSSVHRTTIKGNIRGKIARLSLPQGRCCWPRLSQDFQCQIFKKVAEEGYVDAVRGARLIAGERAADSLLRYSFWPGKVYARAWNFERKDQHLEVAGYSKKPLLRCKSNPDNGVCR